MAFFAGFFAGLCASVAKAPQAFSNGSLDQPLAT
jgi:hypothetical protein